MVGHTVVTGDVDEGMLGVVEVELDEDPQTHADGPTVVEDHEIAFREHSSQPLQLSRVVEVGRVDGGEHRQLQFFEGLGVLHRQVDVFEVTHQRRNSTC